MDVLWASLVVVGFAGVLERLGLPARAEEVARRSRECLAVLQDPALDDDRKEAALQGHARRLFVLLAVLVGGSVLALGLPLGAVWALDRVGWASFRGTWATLQRVDFLAAVSLGGGLLWLILRRRGRT